MNLAYLAVLSALVIGAGAGFKTATPRQIPAGKKVNLVVKKDAPLVLSEPLLVGSGSTILLENGAEIVAAPGKFQGRKDALVQVLGATNVTIRDKGTFRMLKDDYYKPPYEASEHRHCLAIRGSADVLVDNLPEYPCRGIKSVAVVCYTSGEPESGSHFTCVLTSCTISIDLTHPEILTGSDSCISESDTV